jgi:hypothetical protein
VGAAYHLGAVEDRIDGSQPPNLCLRSRDDGPEEAQLTLRQGRVDLFPEIPRTNVVLNVTREIDVAGALAELDGFLGGGRRPRH